MNFLDYLNKDKDEDEVSPLLKKQPEAIADAPPPKDDYASILSQYDSLRKSGNDDVEKAQKKADVKNYLLNVGDGLTSAMGGYAEAVSGGKVRAGNSSFFKDGIDQNNKKVAGVKAGADSKLDDLMVKDKIGRSHVERGQSDELFGQKQKEFAHKEGMRDPDSESSRQARDNIRVVMPNIDKTIPNFEKTTAEQLEKLLPHLTRQSGSRESGRDWQIIPKQGPNGTIEFSRVNKLTGEDIPISGQKGLAPQRITNPITEEHEWVLPGDISAGTIPIAGDRGTSNSDPNKGPREGETAAEYNRRREIEVAKTKKQDVIDLKEEEDIRDAKARKISAEKYYKDILGLYDEASKEGGTGPISGRLSELKNSVGVSSGPATDELITRTGVALAAYIKEMSGTAASDQERKYLMGLIPKASVDRELFKSRIKAAMAEADKIVERNILKARGQSPAEEQRTEVKRQTNKDGTKIRIVYSDGTSEVVDAK